MIQKTTLAVLLFALFASVFAAGAFSVSEPPSDSAALPADAHMRVTLSGEEQRFTFSPAANSVYSVYFFPDGEDAFAEARLYRGGAVRCACLKPASAPEKAMNWRSAARAAAGSK